MRPEKRVGFPKGEVVVWKPTKSRQGFFGSPEAQAPWLVEIISGPYASGKYTVRVLDSRLSKKKNRYAVMASSLISRGSYEQGRHD